MGQDIYLRCGIMQENGQRKSGFQNSGVYTNQACARPVMEQRVSWLQQASHYNSWFLDVAATGMVFDDFGPGQTDHSGTGCAKPHGGDGVDCQESGCAGGL